MVSTVYIVGVMSTLSTTTSMTTSTAVITTTSVARTTRKVNFNNVVILYLVLDLLGGILTDITTVSLLIHHVIQNMRFVNPFIFWSKKCHANKYIGRQHNIMICWMCFSVDNSILAIHHKNVLHKIYHNVGKTWKWN